MKWLRMLGLYFERTFEYRLRSLVWILIPITNNMTLILFWAGTGNTSSSVSTYYILMTLVGLLITSHTEYEVAEVDIKQGGLVNYLTKPVSYYFIQLLSETPYRILHGLYAFLILGGFLTFIPGALQLSLNPFHIPLVILILILGLLISFSFKIGMAYTAFWIKDTTGLFEFFTVVMIIFSGGVMPIPWYPIMMQKICNLLPFAYSGYYPVMAVQGGLSLIELLNIITIQGIWLSVLFLLQGYIWKRGMREFSAIGQ